MVMYSKGRNLQKGRWSERKLEMRISGKEYEESTGKES